MTSREETLIVGGTLRSRDGDYERRCMVKTTRTHINEDEEYEPIQTTYADTNIVDNDDFPDGDYELEFDGERLLLTKSHGEYVAVRQQ